MGLCSSDEEVMRAPKPQVAGTVRQEPKDTEAIKNSEYPELETAVQLLDANKARWVALPIKEKLSLLNEMHTLMMEADHEKWAAEAIFAAGMPPRQAIKPDSGPEMLLAVEMLMNTRILSRDIEGEWPQI